MTIFPVLTSILLEKQLGIFIKNKYGLNENYTCKLFRTGINHTYFLSDNNSKFVLRVYSYSWRSKAEILEEISLLNLLKKNGLNVSYPILDKNGDSIQIISAPEGERYAVLFSFAEGDKVRFINEKNCATIGSLMANMHLVTINKRIDRNNYSLETLLKLPYEYAESHFSASLIEMQFLKKMRDELISTFSQIDELNVKKGVVHMDIWYDNMSITDENEITIFDFDFCGNGWLIFDVAYFCMQLFFIENDKKVYEFKLKRFLDAYNSQLKLSESELKLIPSAGMAVWIFYLGVQSRRFDWSNIFLTENYLKMYVGKMKSWREYHSKK